MASTLSNVLLIEDDVSLGNRIVLGLKREGYRVHIARDGQTGLEMIDQEAFDLVLLDWMLPDIDGLGVFNHVGRRYCQSSNVNRERLESAKPFYFHG